METRKPKPHICDDLGLEETLDAFKPGPFPTKKDVLRHFFHHLWSLKKKDVTVACWLTTDALIEIWKPSYLPLMTRYNVKRNVYRLYDQFHALRCHKKFVKTYAPKKQSFLDDLENRFDVSSEQAEEIIGADKSLSQEEKEEDLTFLHHIRHNLPHSLGSLDVKRIKKGQRIAERQKQASERAAKEENRKRMANATVSSEVIDLLDHGEPDTSPLTPAFNPASSTPTTPNCHMPPSSASSSPLDPDDPDFIGARPAKVGKKSDDITITLNKEKWIRDINLHANRGKMSNADVFNFCAATIQSGGGDLSKFPISKESIRLTRIKADGETAKTIKDNFVFPKFLEVHFDGKIRKHWGTKNDFLALCVTGAGMEKEKLLGDIPIPKGSGLNMAMATLQLLIDWGIFDRVIALCFDTTGSNTGPERGANVLIEQELGWQCLWLACLHHILDLLMEAAVVEKLGPTSGPREKYFAKFETYFNSLEEADKNTIVREAIDRIEIFAPEDEVTRSFQAATKAFFINFMVSEPSFQRRDNLEFAHLVMLLSGVDPNLKWTDKAGAIHHARWMAAAIYILKMLLCGESRFPMGQRQAKGLLDLAYFIVYVFARYWFASPVPADAPFLTLSLWKDIHEWASRDPSLSAVLKRKLDGHTWYLSGRHVVFSLFSSKVDSSTKKKIADAMLLPENEPCDIPPGKPTLPKISPDSCLEDFVDWESWLLFKLTDIQPTFLALEVEKWESDATYIEAKSIVSSFRVVNDAAERAVKFGTDFTGVLTKSKETRQDILQTVELARRAFPRATRKCFLGEVSAASSVEELMGAAQYDARDK